MNTIANIITNNLPHNHTNNGDSYTIPFATEPYAATIFEEGNYIIWCEHPAGCTDMAQAEKTNVTAEELETLTLEIAEEWEEMNGYYQ